MHVGYFGFQFEKSFDWLKRVKLGNNKADVFTNWVERFIQTMLFG